MFSKTAKMKKNIIYFKVLGVLMAGMVSGCVVVEDESSGVYVADLEVKWKIDGSSAASKCDLYGIETWVVDVNGPSRRTVTLDCRSNYWTTENDLFSMDEGYYDIKVRAIDRYGVPITTISTNHDLVDHGYVDVINVNFYDSDF